MMIKKLAPSPRDMVSSPRSHRSPTGGGTGGGALSPRSEGGTTSAAATVRRATMGERPLSPEMSTCTHEKTKVLLSPRTSVGGPIITTANDNTVGESTNANIAASAAAAVGIVQSSTQTSPTILTESPPPPPPARSKRMLVVDPKSGRKYHLHEDDHSLTDKELHVYHRSNRSSTTPLAGGTLQHQHHPASGAEGAAAGESPATTTLNSNPMHATKSPPTNNNNNIGILFVKKSTASSPTTKKNATTNAAAAVLSTLVNDDDARTYNSTALLTLNDDAHTLETASALTEVSYYYHTNNNNCNRNNNNDDDGYCVGGGGIDGQKKTSGPFDCYLPTGCNSVGDLAGVACNDSTGNTALVGAAAATAAAAGGGGGGVQQAQGKKEGRDDVESMGRYRQYLLDEDQKKKTTMTTMMTNTATLSPRNSSSIYSSGNHNKDGGNDYSHYQLQQQQQQQQPEQSPITAAFSAIMDSPRLLFSGFFGNNQHNDNHLVTGGDTALQHPLAATATTSAPMVVRQEVISFRRVVCMVVFPNEVRNTLDGKEVGLLGMKFEQSGHDFQAHVKWVQRGSKAEKMGVRRGDIVSFAVALSNMTEKQNCFLAEKLIKRLESVGMRTSYRELHDIFLSKTTNARPIGIVFRRWRNRGGGSRGGSPKYRATMIESPSYPTNNICITNEFEWSTDFLQCLSIKCREYEFDLKVPSIRTTTNIDNNNNLMSGSVVNKLQSFLPPPNVETAMSNNGSFSYFLNYIMDNLSLGYGVQSSPLMKCMDSPLGITNAAEPTSKDCSKQEKADFLSNRILCSLVEQSMGLIFLRRLSTSKTCNKDRGAVGSGFALMRKADGSWSAPCFLCILGSKDEFTECADEQSASYLADDVKMIIIHKKELVINLIGGNAVKFTVRKDERAHVLVRDAAVIGVQDGRFQLATDFFLSVKVNDVQNQGAYVLSTEYRTSEQITAFDILTGTVSPPDQSVDFYGALQSLELPYSMHSHPVVPDILQRYSDSDWVEFLPDNGSFASSCGMRTKLEMIAQRNASPDDMLELDIFARKFKYYLMDGVPVHRVNSSSKGRGTTEEKVLRLTIKDPNCIFTSSLELTRKLLPGVSNVGVPSNFSTTLESITKMSRSPPVGMSWLDDDERKRYFSIETDLSPGPIMMLAKSKKDVMILLCGLKLLLEMEKMAQS